MGTLIEHWKRRLDSARAGTLALLENRTQAELDREFPDFPHTLGDLARHVAATQDFAVTRVLLGQKDEFYYHHRDRFPTVEAVLADMRTYHNMLLEWLSSHDESDLVGEYATPDGKTKRPRRVLMWRLLLHEVHHRAQMAMLIRRMGAEPPKCTDARDDDVGCDELEHWPDVRAKLKAAISSAAQDQLDWKSPDYPHSIGDLARHVAEAEEAWVRGVLMRDGYEYRDHARDEYPDAASIAADLDRVHAFTLAEMSRRDASMFEVVAFDDDGNTRRATPARVFWHLLEHEVHHRAQVYALLRMQAIDPPAW